MGRLYALLATVGLLLCLSLVMYPSYAQEPTPTPRPLPPERFSSNSISTAHVWGKIPIAVAGQAIDEGVALAVPIGGDIDMPAWGHDERYFYPWTPCLRPPTWLMRAVAHDPNGAIGLPSPTGNIMGGPDQVQCFADENGNILENTTAFPIPVSRVPVTALSGNTPVPCFALTAVYGRNGGYTLRGMHTYHEGTDMVGGCTIQVDDYTLPRNTIVLPVQCEPVCVRAGLVVCATPMSTSWTSNVPVNEWSNYWAGDGLTLYTVFLHVNTCYVTQGIIAEWASHADLLQGSRERPDTFASAYPGLTPARGMVLTTYCHSPTEERCATLAPHLHFQFGVVDNAQFRNVMSHPGTERIQPNYPCETGGAERYSCPDLYWSGMARWSTTGFPLYANYNELVTTDSNLAGCFGATGGTYSALWFVQQLQTLSPDRIPTPAQLLNEAQYASVMREWMAWYNSLLYTTYYGPCSPVASFPCLGGETMTLVQDMGYPGSHGYSGNCVPSYPPLPSRECAAYEYIPGHGDDISLQHQEYFEGAARALFLLAWWYSHGVAQ